MGSAAQCWDTLIYRINDKTNNAALEALKLWRHFWRNVTVFVPKECTWRNKINASSEKSTSAGMPTNAYFMGGFYHLNDKGREIWYSLFCMNDLCSYSFIICSVGGLILSYLFLRKTKHKCCPQQEVTLTNEIEFSTYTFDSRDCSYKVRNHTNERSYFGIFLPLRLPPKRQTWRKRPRSTKW